MNKNHEVSERLDSWYKQLTPRAWEAISDTDINCIADIFGGLSTAEEVNAFVEELDRIYGI